MTLDRAIRVFVSSTFRDMAAEREELVKRVFPQLRQLCEQREVTWGEVDLRWGITDEQKAEGDVLPICLAEIRRSRPYFIGLLGERYGWVPDRVDPGLASEEPWLRENVGCSVTELEVLHGVLNDPEMAEHAFFYLRDPAYLERVPAAERGDYVEADPALATRLAALKRRIRGSGFPVREDYSDPRALGALVLSDFTALIESLFPAGSEPDPLEREAAMHEAFARSRAQVYIRGPGAFERLDEYVETGGLPLLVLGDSGSGKSALLANWALSRRSAHPEEFLVAHFIGASAESSDWRAMCRRLIGELARRSGRDIEIPEEPDKLRQTFANCLSLAASRGKVVLVIDALDQLGDREGARSLTWLPSELPPELRLVVSTLPGDSLDAGVERGWQTLEVGPLRESEREELITLYLAQYTKRLSEDRVRHIASFPQTASPLYLRALLEELRLWGQHETLDERINHYLTSPDPTALFGLVLERLEADYERERPGLVGAATSFIWAAREGIAESELLDLLGENGNALPRAVWSPLFLAADASLVDRSGRLAFFHDYLAQAVERRYLSSPELQKGAHLALARYFARNRLGPRAARELPWQLAKAGDWQSLADVLADPDFFLAAWSSDSYDVQSAWAAIEASSDLRLPDSCGEILQNPARYRSCAYPLCLLLFKMGYADEALDLSRRLVEVYQQARDLGSLLSILQTQAGILSHRGDLDAAADLLKRIEGPCRDLLAQASTENPTGAATMLARVLRDRAGILRNRGQLDEAWALGMEEERILRDLGDTAGLLSLSLNRALILRERGELDEAMAMLLNAEHQALELGDLEAKRSLLGQRALIFSTRGKLDEAMELLQDQEAICRELGDMRGLVESLNNRAHILYGRGQLVEALSLHQEQEQVSRRSGYKSGLAIALGNQALILNDLGQADEAMMLHQEEERLYRELDDKVGLGFSLGNQALIHLHRGQSDQAMALHKEEERLCREVGDQEGLQACLGHQAIVIASSGDLEQALLLLKEQERICREVDIPDGIQMSLTSQASILRNFGRNDEALLLLKEAERLARGLGKLAGLQKALGSQGDVLIDDGRAEEGLALLAEATEVCRQLGEPVALRESLERQASALYYMRRPEAALPLFEEAENISRDMGDQNALQVGLGYRAVALAAAGRFDEAMALLEEQERICRALGDPSATQAALSSKAELLRKQDRLDQALGCLRDAEVIAREVSDEDGLASCLFRQAMILATANRADEAMLVFKEQERVCRDSGNVEGLRASLDHQATLHYSRGEFDEALSLHREAEHLSREAGDLHGVRVSVGNQAMVLSAKGELAGALALLKEAEHLCRENDDPYGLQAALGEQARILYAKGQLDEAMALLKEVEYVCRELGEPQGLFQSLGGQAAILQARGQGTEARAILAEQERIQRQLGGRPG